MRLAFTGRYSEVGAKNWVWGWAHLDQMVAALAF